jgi:hypothetical protein
VIGAAEIEMLLGEFDEARLGRGSPDVTTTRAELGWPVFVVAETVVRDHASHRGTPCVEGNICVMRPQGEGLAG